MQSNEENEICNFCGSLFKDHSTNGDKCPCTIRAFSQDMIFQPSGRFGNPVASLITSCISSYAPATGIELRDWFAGRAPAVPDWFKATFPALPVWPRLETMFNDKEAGIIQSYFNDRTGLWADELDGAHRNYTECRGATSDLRNRHIEYRKTVSAYIAAAMQWEYGNGIASLTQWAYFYADAMMNERAKSAQEGATNV